MQARSAYSIAFKPVLEEASADRGTSSAPLTTDDVPALLGCHAAGDWGELDAQDHHANETALRIGERLLSAYTVPSPGRRVWVITEADRSATTILLPSEY